MFSNRSESGMSVWLPGLSLEHAISNWAQHVQHAAPGGTQTGDSAFSAMSLISAGMF